MGLLSCLPGQQASLAPHVLTVPSSTEGISGREFVTKEMEELGARHQWVASPLGPQGGSGVTRV